MQLPAPLDLLGRKREVENVITAPFLPLPNAKRVTILEDTDLAFPELWLNVFVFGPEAGPSFNKLFARCKCFKAETPGDADLVVFTGSGHDVDPQLYGELPHKSTEVNAAIDKANLTLYGYCVKHGIPMFGVCGGAQILHVAEGGKLYQDVDGHNGPHTMWDVVGKQLIQRVSSVHHQLCIPNEAGGMEVIGKSNAARERWLNDKESRVGSQMDVEAFYYRKHCIIGVQGHPEYAGYNAYTVWCMKQLDHYLNENPDLSYTSSEGLGSRLRIKEELRAEERLVSIPSEEMIIVEAKGN